MILSRYEISQLKPGINNVIIKLDLSQENITIAGSKEIKIDTSFNPEQHAAITGTVIAVCDKLHFNTIPGQSHSLDWDTDMEVQPGDYVISYYLSSVNAMAGDGRVFMDELKHKYIILKYDKIFAARRGDTVIPVNGFNLLTPILESELKGIASKLKKLDLHLPQQHLTLESGIYARLKYVATRLRQYRDPRYRDFTDEISPGDIVVIRRRSNIPLEYAYHASLEGKQVFYRIQRNFIFGVADESIFAN